jgi:hypothetical protein
MDRPELTHDGHGINGPDEHRSRVATFSDKEKNGPKYGPLFAAAPELLEALKLVWVRNSNHDTLTFDELNSVRALIAKAKGESKGGGE